MTAIQRSPFLSPYPTAQAQELAILHLRRDLQKPVIINAPKDGLESDVVNTRFGSYAHACFVDQPWGSQILASTSSTAAGRGRSSATDKRKRPDAGPASPSKRQKTEDGEDHDNDTAHVEIDVTGHEEATAGRLAPTTTGFVYLVPPTPENWTTSLPHRTQVVYTPDYSHILHRLRARPGTSIIEAGAGSGSFTHAAARAVFSGYPDSAQGRKLGKVWSYELHEQRHEKMVKEIEDHGLAGIVHLTRRNVCSDGFLVDTRKEQIPAASQGIQDEHDSQAALSSSSDAIAGSHQMMNGAANAENVSPSSGRTSPEATAVFLDLPAPWLALPHLTRSASAQKGATSQTFTSPLDPQATVYICTFSPCIEQVQRTITSLRTLGWVDIETIEIAHRKLEVRRELSQGTSSDSAPGMPANVEEVVQRLAEVEAAGRIYHNGDPPKKKKTPNARTRENVMRGLIERKTYKDGQLVHRMEPDVKTHTSYLTFAILPREWSAEDEAEARAKYSSSCEVEGSQTPVIGLSRRQIARAAQEAERATAADSANPVLSKKQLKRAQRHARQADGSVEGSQIAPDVVDPEAKESVAAVASAIP